MKRQKFVKLKSIDLTEVHRWICAWKIAHDGNSPTYREIGAEFGDLSTSQSRRLLNLMVKAALIRLVERDRKQTTIEVVGGQWIPPASHRSTSEAGAVSMGIKVQAVAEPEFVDDLS